MLTLIIQFAKHWFQEHEKTQVLQLWKKRSWEGLLESFHPSLCSVLDHLRSCSNVGSLPVPAKRAAAHKAYWAWCLPKCARKPCENTLAATEPGTFPQFSSVDSHVPLHGNTPRQAWTCTLGVPRKVTCMSSFIGRDNIGCFVRISLLQEQCHRNIQSLPPKLWKINRGRNCTFPLILTGSSNSNRSYFSLKRKGIFCTIEQLRPRSLCSNVVVDNLCIKNVLVNPSFV